MWTSNERTSSRSAIAPGADPGTTRTAAILGLLEQLPHPRGIPAEERRNRPDLLELCFATHHHRARETSREQRRQGGDDRTREEGDFGFRVHGGRQYPPVGKKSTFTVTKKMEPFQMSA